MHAGSQALKKKFKFKTRRRREDAIAAALQEAAIAADNDQVRLHQIQILEALFEMFFRVLKRCTASGLLRPPEDGGSPQGQLVAELSAETIERKWPLLSATLQGLAKYTHLIGLEYFNDLMEVLQQLQGCAALPLVLRMRCLLTTVDILHAQSDALNVDRRRMHAHLYNTLSVCTLQPLRDDEEDFGGEEEGRKNSQALQDGVGLLGGSVGSCSVLVVRVATQMLTALKPGDAARLGAFVKRLCACAMHAEPGLSLAMLAITARCLSLIHI